MSCIDYLSEVLHEMTDKDRVVAESLLRVSQPTEKQKRLAYRLWKNTETGYKHACIEEGYNS